jgi:hypothetical protein
MEAAATTLSRYLKRLREETTSSSERAAPLTEIDSLNYKA